MGDEPKTTQGPDPAGDEPKGTSPESKKETQTQKPAKTYTQAEVDNITRNVGRQIRDELQTVQHERDDLKGKLSTEIAAKQTEIDNLTAEIDELAKDDPDKTDLVKLRREAKVKLATLAAKEAEANTKFRDREAKVQKFERDQMIFEIADTYTTADGKDTDPDSLMKASDRLKVSDRDGIVALAEEKGWKLKAATKEPEVEVAHLDSGHTSGGRGTFTRTQIKDRKFWSEHKAEIEKAQKEGRIRD